MARLAADFHVNHHDHQPLAVNVGGLDRHTERGIGIYYGARIYHDQCHDDQHHVDLCERGRLHSA